MDNNGILRRLTYVLDFKNKDIINVFKLVDVEINKSEISGWMKKETEEEFIFFKEKYIIAFLNGLVVLKRGKNEGVELELEKRIDNKKRIDNNLIFRKLRIAFELKDEDIVDILKLVNFKLTKSELSAFFRSQSHPNYRECKDQILRNFLNGLARKFRS